MTYLDAVLLLEPVVELLEGNGRVRIVADLHELDAELAHGDAVRLEAPRGVDDDGLRVVRCGPRVKAGWATHPCEGLTRDAVGDHDDAGWLRTLLFEPREIPAEDLVELLAGGCLACRL